MALSLTPIEIEVLTLLAKLGDSYGLELIKASEAAAGALKRGTVYLVLQRMEEELLIESYLERAALAHIAIKRRIYRLTTIGRRYIDQRLSDGV